MNNQPLLVVHVKIQPNEISELQASPESVVMIPFTGTVEGSIFNGKILPGGVDTQVVNTAGVRHMCARYMLEGTDNAGESCRVYVENNGYFEKGSVEFPFHTVPTFMTDSKALAPYLHTRKFRGEGHPAEDGVDIIFFEVE